MSTRKLKAESSKLKAKTKEKRKRVVQSPSRIPGVQVGDEVGTSLGVRKKVCFNVGGRWVFRMVDPEWRAPGRPKKSRGRKSEVGGQRKRGRKEVGK